MSRGIAFPGREGLEKSVLKVTFVEGKQGTSQQNPKWGSGSKHKDKEGRGYFFIQSHHKVRVQGVQRSEVPFLKALSGYRMENGLKDIQWWVG